MTQFFRQLTLFFIFLIVITYAWVGAEYVVEGVVHSSEVDGFIAIVLSSVLAVDVERMLWGDT